MFSACRNMSTNNSNSNSTFHRLNSRMQQQQQSGVNLFLRTGHPSPIATPKLSQHDDIPANHNQQHYTNQSMIVGNEGDSMILPPASSSSSSSAVSLGMLQSHDDGLSGKRRRLSDGSVGSSSNGSNDDYDYNQEGSANISAAAAVPSPPVHRGPGRPKKKTTKSFRPAVHHVPSTVVSTNTPPPMHNISGNNLYSSPLPSAVQVPHATAPPAAQMMYAAEEDSQPPSTIMGRDKLMEVSCKICGKRYKNYICLQKHAWEHHNSWPYTKRLMLNKHQSVQIMEAAHILMNIQCHSRAPPTESVIIAGGYAYQQSSASVAGRDVPNTTNTANNRQRYNVAGSLSPARSDTSF